MGEVILGVVFAVIVTAAIFIRESFRSNDQSGIYCPRSQSVVAIQDGVCRDKGGLRIVGVAPACQRECLITGGAGANAH
jgi:hypothetical protein